MQIPWIKDFFKQTNIRRVDEKPTLDHNVEKFNLMVRDNINIFSSTKTLTEANKIVALQVNPISGIKNITKDLKCHMRKDTHIRLRHSWLSSNYWYLAETAADNVGVPGLINTLAVFIKQEQAKVRDIESAFNKRQKKDDSSWTKKYLI